MRPDKRDSAFGTRHSALLLLLVAGAANAQVADTAARPQQDSVLARAKQLSRDGRDADGRKLIDSLLASLTPDSSRYAEALYSRGAMAPTAADAERDYRRLLIEAPLSARAEDALLQLAQLEQARGDRRGASDHLQRYLLSYPQSAARARVSVQLVRLLFDQGPQQLARACDALKNAKQDVPVSSVELRNQLEAQAPRCAYVDTQVAAAAPADSSTPPVDSTRPTVAPADTAKPVTATTPTPPVATQPATQPSGTTVSATQPANAGNPVPTPSIPAAPAAAGSGSTPQPAAFYSVQLAAYDSQDAATRMVQQLVARGIDARVDGARPPYRVRVGKYQTRADAAKASTDLKAKGHNGFITLVSPTK